MSVISVKLQSIWSEAGSKYEFGKNIGGLCIDYSLLNIAQMAGKDIEFSVKRRKNKYRIAPMHAKEVCKQYKSVYTRKRDRKPVAVVPISACEVI